MEFRLIKISGAPREMGKDLGRQARSNIRAGLTFYKKYWEKMMKISWLEAKKILASSIPLTKKLLPKTFEELQGMALGSGTSFDDLFVVNSMEALSRYERCTSVVVKIGRKILFAHNEDWIAADKKWLYLVKATPKDEPKFLALGYGAWLPTYGLNSAGLAFAADSLTATDASRGLSQTLISREILRASSIEEATQRIKLLPSADGHAYILAQARGEMIVLETTASQSVLIRPRGNCLIHTNFYQSPRLKRFERDIRTHARFRYARVRELLKKEKQINEKILFKILGDHKNFPRSVCRHMANAQKKYKEETIASFVIDIEERRLSLVSGQPCGQSSIQSFHCPGSDT